MKKIVTIMSIMVSLHSLAWSYDYTVAGAGTPSVDGLYEEAGLDQVAGEVYWVHTSGLFILTGTASTGFAIWDAARTTSYYSSILAGTFSWPNAPLAHWNAVSGSLPVPSVTGIGIPDHQVVGAGAGGVDGVYTYAGIHPASLFPYWVHSSGLFILVENYGTLSPEIWDVTYSTHLYGAPAGHSMPITDRPDWFAVAGLSPAPAVSINIPAYVITGAGTTAANGSYTYSGFDPSTGLQRWTHTSGQYKMNKNFYDHNLWFDFLIETYPPPATYLYNAIVESPDTPGWGVITGIPPAPFGAVDEALSIQEVLATDFMVGAAYPNPFNPATSLNYHLPSADNVSIRVFNLKGEMVQELTNEYQNAGFHRAQWDASASPSGFYFIQTVSGSYSATQKVTLVK